MPISEEYGPFLANRAMHSRVEAKSYCSLFLLCPHHLALDTDAVMGNVHGTLGKVNPLTSYRRTMKVSCRETGIALGR